MITLELCLRDENSLGLLNMVRSYLCSRKNDSQPALLSEILKGGFYGNLRNPSKSATE